MVSVFVWILSITSLIINAIAFHKARKLYNTPMRPLIKEGYFIHEQSENKYVFRKILTVNFMHMDDDFIFAECEKKAPMFPYNIYKEIIFTKNKYGFWRVSTRLHLITSSENSDYILSHVDSDTKDLNEYDVKAILKVIKTLNKDAKRDIWL